MGLYIDENGEHLNEWEEGRLDGREEVLEQLVFSLGDYIRAGTLSLAAAVTMYATAAEWTEDDAADFLCEYWSELMSARWDSLGDMTT
ncbi:hypothetical protein P8A22_36250 [Streptomyces laculatispora]|uniref:Uncharacterized protein n=1 Tax=Streptomyces laculatispora TaxID=887464 RepID=A0ABY9ID79_9ACTN|nr:hypothetical protein [Streptomyces laculatispora]WLQ44870.1 hypothetical protein P8A22_36250 [Streptomyces laculatispora]